MVYNNTKSRKYNIQVKRKTQTVSVFSGIAAALTDGVWDTRYRSVKLVEELLFRHWDPAKSTVAFGSL